MESFLPLMILRLRNWVKKEMKVIGVIGQNGSGKDEVLKYLFAKCNIPFLSTGDIVREIAAKETKDPTRDNLHKISESYFRKFGRGYFMKLAAAKMDQNGWTIGGITGIRSIDDIEVLRSIFGRDFVLINVYVSDLKKRYRRLRGRHEARDPHTFQEFLQQDKTEEELFHIQSASQKPDYSLNNDGTINDLHKAIDTLITQHILCDTDGHSPKSDIGHWI
jgi:dephospho-CoA kinase